MDFQQILFQNRDESGKRDYLYYLAIGNARIKEYQTALKFVRGLLQVEPGNRQAQELEQIIKKKMEKEGLIGMAVVGGATLALGGLVGLGIALAKSSKSWVWIYFFNVINQLEQQPNRTKNILVFS